MVVSHREIRQWRANGEVQRSSYPQNSYYHSDVACTQKNNPSFQKHMLVVSPEMKASFKQEHKDYLREHFNLTLWLIWLRYTYLYNRPFLTGRFVAPFQTMW